MAALVSPEAPEIPRWNYVCRRYAEVHGHLDFFLATVLAFALVRLGAMHVKQWCHKIDSPMMQEALVKIGNCVLVLLGMGEADCDGIRNISCHNDHRVCALVVGG